MKKVNSSFRNGPINKAMFLLLIVFAGTQLFGQVAVFAVGENTTNLPEGLTDGFFSSSKPVNERQFRGGPLRTTGAGVRPVGPPGNACGGARNNFQYSWVSADSDAKVKEDLQASPYDL